MNDIIAAVVASTTANGILAWIFQTWFAEKVRQKVSFEYGQKLETLKAQLTAQHETAIERLRGDNAKMQAVQATANASLAEGHKASHERRLKAIEVVWNAICENWSRFPAVLFFSDNLLVTEYDEYYGRDDNRGLVDSLSAHEYQRSLKAVWEDTEKCRPFFGEELYRVFYVQRAVLGRVYFLFTQGFEKGKIPDWRKDSGIRQILSWTLASEEVDALLQKEIGPLAAIHLNLELKALAQIHRVISGQAAGEFSMEESKRLAEMVAGLTGN